MHCRSILPQHSCPLACKHAHTCTHTRLLPNLMTLPCIFQLLCVSRKNRICFGIMLMRKMWFHLTVHIQRRVETEVYWSFKRITEKKVFPPFIKCCQEPSFQNGIKASGRCRCHVNLEQEDEVVKFCPQSPG